MKRTITATLAVALTIAIMAIGVVAQVNANTQKIHGTYVVNGTHIILLKEDGTPFMVVKIKMWGWANSTHGKLQHVGNDTYILLREDGTPFTVNGHVVKIKIINGTGGPASAAPKTEPDITIVSIPISGSLPPQTYDVYGPFSSALQIDVPITWTPASQILGVGIVEAITGQGYGYWYTGGSATATFSIDPNKTYYILILYTNNQVIKYNGVIRLYIW